MQSLLYRVYHKTLTLYLREGGSGAGWRKQYEHLIDLLVPPLSRFRRFTFPDRKTGGWYWISRWRFEVLMGWYEPETDEWFRKLIKPGHVVLDVGGHLGVHSRRFSKLVGRNGRVYVFEANPENYQILRHNLGQNRFGNAEVVYSAIAEHDGAVTLHLSPGHSNHSLNPGYTSNTGVVEVPCTSIDSFCAKRRIDRVDFIKVDTEGAEPMVLRGMQATLAANPSIVLLVEHNPAALRAGGVEPQSFLALLGDLGLRYHSLTNDGSLGPVPELSGNQYVNLLCTRA
jgi:FkbM family methyltransferase